jgi:hypothetical protein
MRCRADRCGRLVEQGELLCGRFQSIGPQRRPLQPYASSRTAEKQICEDRLEIGFPTGAMRQRLLYRSFDVIAVSNGQREAPADSPLLPQRGTDLFDQTGEPSHNDMVIDFVRIERERLFDRRLFDGRTNGRVIDAQGPIMQ